MQLIRNKKELLGREVLPLFITTKLKFSQKYFANSPKNIPLHQK